MTKPTQTSRYPTHPSVYLAAHLVHSLIWQLPSGTAFCIGVVLITLLTGQLMQHKGSLARAALPYVGHVHWGWHRVERALERGKLSLDQLFDVAYAWCLVQLPVEPVCLGEQQREVWALDTSTIARLRAGAKLGLAGKGYCHRCQRAVQANIVAVATRVVQVAGVRVGLVRRTRFGQSCEQAIEVLWADLLGAPQMGRPHKRLYVVDAGIATVARFAAATEQAAILGRLRINAKLRCARAPRPDTPGPGRPAQHGAVLHPGRVKRKGRVLDAPEVAPVEEFTVQGVAGPVRLRRWNTLHYE